jgi:hypothetical protein
MCFIPGKQPLEAKQAKACLSHQFISFSLLSSLLPPGRRELGNQSGSCSLKEQLLKCPAAAKLVLTSTKEELNELKDTLGMVEKLLQPGVEEVGGQSSVTAFKVGLGGEGGGHGATTADLGVNKQVLS